MTLSILFVECSGTRNSNTTTGTSTTVEARSDHRRVLFGLDPPRTQKFDILVTLFFHTDTTSFDPLKKSFDRTLVHPDGDIPVAGNVVPELSQMKRIVQEAHGTLCPHVPFCGWDIVLCTNTTTPICLLEVNLSCNFFRGTFDSQV